MASPDQQPSSAALAAYNYALVSHIGGGEYASHYPSWNGITPWMEPFDPAEQGYPITIKSNGTRVSPNETAAYTQVTALDLTAEDLCKKACPLARNRRGYFDCDGMTVDQEVGDAKCGRNRSYYELPLDLQFKR